MLQATCYTHRPSDPAATRVSIPRTSAAPASSLRIYLRLLGYLRPLLGLFAVSLLGYLMFASSQPTLAAILKYFVDGLNAARGSTQYSIPLLGELELLGLLLITIGKIFLYDVGELTDLYRVGALLGLALSLIVVSLVYQRFVFRAGADEHVEGT